MGVLEPVTLANRLLLILHINPNTESEAGIMLFSFLKVDGYPLPTPCPHRGQFSLSPAPTCEGEVAGDAGGPGKLSSGVKQSDGAYLIFCSCRPLI